MIIRNRISARVMRGVVMEGEKQLQAAAATCIAGKSGFFAAVRCRDVADVLTYLIARPNCVNERGL